MMTILEVFVNNTLLQLVGKHQVKIAKRNVPTVFICDFYWWFFFLSIVFLTSTSLMFGHTFNRHCRYRKWGTIEKEIQLWNQSQHEFDLFNRGKMQCQNSGSTLNQRLLLHKHAVIYFMSTLLCCNYFVCFYVMYYFKFCCPILNFLNWVYLMSQQYKADNWL